MKKIALFMAFAAISLTSCSNDDDNNSPTLSAAYLGGVWVETAPTADMHTLRFDGNTARLNRQFSVIGEYTYQISGNTLLLTAEGVTTPSQHTVTIVNDSVMKLSNFVFVGPAENSLPPEDTSMTFTRLND
jgi:hypothetical protein